jgi:hypothetical protein
LKIQTGAETLPPQPQRKSPTTSDSPSEEEDSRRRAGRFGVELDSKDFVAYRGQQKAEFGGNKIAWDTFCFLIDQSARCEFVPAVKEASGTHSFVPHKIYSDLRKMIESIGLTVSAPRGKGAIIEELPQQQRKESGAKSRLAKK